MPRALASGAIVGEVEEVASGRVRAISDLAELLSFLRGCAVEEVS